MSRGLAWMQPRSGASGSLRRSITEGEILRIYRKTPFPSHRISRCGSAYSNSCLYWSLMGCIPSFIVKGSQALTQGVEGDLGAVGQVKLA